MPSYRKVPVTVEAREVTTASAEDVSEWCRGRLFTFENNDDAYIEIQTLEGTMMAGLGDFVIQGVQGEFYPCKPEIFEATYEKVSE
jgi:hypothetical protein